MKRERIDPEPIVMIMALLSASGASIAAANYVKTHLKPAPTHVRALILGLLARLEDECRHLRADVATLRDIFGKAEHFSDHGIRVRHGAYLTPNDFHRYEIVSDDVLHRLRNLNKIGLKLEKQVGRSAGLEVRVTTNYLGEAYDKLERLIDAQRLSEVDAWGELDQLLELVEKAISEVRQQLALE